MWTAGCRRSKLVRVGSKNFTEQVVLGEIIAQQIERRVANVRVERKLNLGGTLLTHQALLAKEIDLYPEYTGTALTAVLKDPVGTEPAIVLERVRLEYRRLSQIEWLNPLGLDNTFAMTIRGEDARNNHLETLTQAAGSKVGWALGMGYEFDQRPDGFATLLRTYKLEMRAAPRAMDLGLLYRALEAKQVNIVAGNATDAMLAKMDVKVLADDQHVFPPYQACIAVRQDAMDATPGLRQALEALSGKLNNDVMRKLNYQVDIDHKPAAEVARDWLATIP